MKVYGNLPYAVFMTNTIIATFIRRRFHESGKDLAPDFYVYEFTNVKDINGKKYSDKWIKETKLMQAVPFKKGKEYRITLNDKYSFGNIRNCINLPYPIEVTWDNEKVYMKGGNSIVKVDSKKREKNLSEPLNKIIGISNHDTAAMKKFGKGIMTEKLLLQMNSKGTFFQVAYIDPQDKRKNMIYSYSLSTDKKKGNFVLIQKETKEQVDNDLKEINDKYLNKSIRKHFKIIKRIIATK